MINESKIYSHGLHLLYYTGAAERQKEPSVSIRNDICQLEHNGPLMVLDFFCGTLPCVDSTLFAVSADQSPCAASLTIVAKSGAEISAGSCAASVAIAPRHGADASHTSLEREYQARQLISAARSSVAEW